LKPNSSEVSLDAARSEMWNSRASGKGAPLGYAANECRAHGEEGNLVKHLYEIGEFVRRLRLQARFGDLSRAPLRLLRVQVCGEHAECDWVARPADDWDRNLPSRVGDASKRKPEVFELIIIGTIRRDQHAPGTVRSLAMRAKLFGLRFWLDDGVLEDLQPEEYAVNS
jgi:hypothetical protein